MLIQEYTLFTAECDINRDRAGWRVRGFRQTGGASRMGGYGLYETAPCAPTVAVLVPEPF